MNTKDFHQPVSSRQIQENLVKQFGTKVNLGKYTREQLEDMRNKLRTRVFQQESSAGYNDLLTNETYQKDQVMLQLLNTRIKEMLGEQMQKLRDRMDQLSENKKSVKTVKKSKGSKGTDQTGDGKSDVDDIQVARMVAGGVPKKKAIAKATTDNVKEETGKFDKKDTTWTDSKGEKHPAQRVTRKTDQLSQGEEDKPKEKKVKETSHQEKTTMKHVNASDASPKVKAAIGKAAKDIKPGVKGYKDRADALTAAGIKREGIQESNFKHNVRFVNESLAFLINEDEEGKAKAITAASDIVNDFTSWMQRVGQYQTKAIIELADAIKADFGAAEAEAFKQSVAPALSATLETLTQQREAISSAVAVLAGEAAPEEPMGMEPGMGGEEPGMDMTAPDEMNPEPAGDEFAGADAAAGDGTAGRAVRESKFSRKLAESHSIMSKLAK